MVFNGLRWSRVVSDGLASGSILTIGCYGANKYEEVHIYQIQPPSHYNSTGTQIHKRKNQTNFKKSEPTLDTFFLYQGCEEWI